MAFEITDECSGCSACVPSCPAGAIRGIARSLHQIDPALCIDCGACGVVCPDQAVRDPRGPRRQAKRTPVSRSASAQRARATASSCAHGSIFAGPGGPLYSFIRTGP